MNAFMIDHATDTVNKTIRVLGKRKDVRACQFAGLYHQDKTYCQIYVETEMGEETLDHWLWSTLSVGDYIGVVETECSGQIGVETLEMATL